ncbi:MAG: hypothetical protein WC798_00810 [Candidatus Paceibacterota bacterium]|jgi:hypothetical protein
MKSNTSTLSSIIALFVIAAGVYWYFFSGTDEQLPLTIGEPESQVQTKFQALASELQPISFDTSIFSDPRFNALVDFTTPVSPEATGRLDPFAPVVGVGISD